MPVAPVERVELGHALDESERHQENHAQRERDRERLELHAPLQLVEPANIADPFDEEEREGRHRQERDRDPEGLRDRLQFRGGQGADVENRERKGRGEEPGAAPRRCLGLRARGQSAHHAVHETLLLEGGDPFAPTHQER